MANLKISELTAATTALAGTEVLPIVQSSATVKVSVANLTAGRAITATSLNGLAVSQGGGSVATNTAVGTSALAANTTGNYATAIGYLALSANTGNTNTGIGAEALAQNTSGAANTSVGNAALYSNTTGVNSTAMGQGALQNSTSGSQNTAFGRTALFSNTTASNNVAVGYQALYSNTVASQNTAIGIQAGYAVVTGDNNTFLGYQAGDAVTGSRNVVLGRNADTSTAAGNDQIVIGSTAVGKGNDTFFHNAGNSYNGGNTTTWATTSDARIKKNVVEVSNGLNIINALRPVEFEYKENDKHEVGFIAQEYATVLPNQVKTHDANSAQKEWVDSDGKVFFIQQNLVPYLVKAIQELKAEIDQLKGNV